MDTGVGDIKPSDILPTNDVAFKFMLGNPRHPNGLIYFLNCARVSPDPIVSVEILNPEVLIENVTLKAMRLDIKAKTNKDEIVIIEMQCAKDDCMAARVLEYWADSFSSQLKKGEYYGELKRTVSISVLNFKLFKEDNRFWRKCHLMDDAGEVITDLLELQFVELPKTNKVDENEPLTCWAEFLKNPYSKETEEICEKIPEIKEAKDMYEKTISDPKKFEMIKARERAIRDFEGRMAHERREGIAEGIEKGIAEGIEKGKFGIVKNMLRKGFDFVTISDISGLPIDQIKAIRI